MNLADALRREAVVGARYATILESPLHPTVPRSWSGQGDLVRVPLVMMSPRRRAYLWRWLVRRAERISMAIHAADYGFGWPGIDMPDEVLDEADRALDERDDPVDWLRSTPFMVELEDLLDRSGGWWVIGATSATGWLRDRQIESLLTKHEGVRR